MDKLTRRELELSQKHEELLLRRETLLRGTETYYDRQESRSASFISDFGKAKQRNATLHADLHGLKDDLRSQGSYEGNQKFKNLVANYWTMVRKVYPEWLEEQRAYERQHGLPTSTLPDPSVISGNMASAHSTIASTPPSASPRGRSQPQPTQSKSTRRRRTPERTRSR